LRTQLEEKERYLLAIKVVISRAASENGYNTHNNIKEGHPGPPTTHIHTNTHTQRHTFTIAIPNIAEDGSLPTLPS